MNHETRFFRYCARACARTVRSAVTSVPTSCLRRETVYESKTYVRVRIAISHTLLVLAESHARKPYPIVARVLRTMVCTQMHTSMSDLSFRNRFIFSNVCVESNEFIFFVFAINVNGFGSIQVSVCVCVCVFRVARDGGRYRSD